jgi:hypothetical protein
MVITLIRPYLFRFHYPVFDAVGGSRAHVPIFRFTATVILVWPQFAFALLGGSLFRRLKFGKNRV